MRSRYSLRRSGRELKLERIPMELLLFLVERRGLLVTREEIIEKLWGRNVFLDTDNSINTAIRKIRNALKDDREQPRFVQTIAGKGYRFIAPIIEADEHVGHGHPGSPSRIERSVTEPSPKDRSSRLAETAAATVARDTAGCRAFSLFCVVDRLPSSQRSVHSPIVTMRASGGFLSARYRRYDNWLSTESLWLLIFFFAKPSK